MIFKSCDPGQRRSGQRFLAGKSIRNPHNNEEEFHMNAAVVYWSGTGNTEAMAQAVRRRDSGSRRNRGGM